MIFILDVRKTVSEDFKDKSIKCCSDIIKQKVSTIFEYHLCNNVVIPNDAQAIVSQSLWMVDMVVIYENSKMYTA